LPDSRTRLTPIRHPCPLSFNRVSDFSTQSIPIPRNGSVYLPNFETMTNSETHEPVAEPVAESAEAPKIDGDMGTMFILVKISKKLFLFFVIDGQAK